MITESKIQLEYVRHPESLKPSLYSRSLATKTLSFHRQNNKYFTYFLENLKSPKNSGCVDTSGFPVGLFASEVPDFCA